MPAPPRFGRAVLGGTFDRLHVGHECLLETAFRVGRSVAIGLTTEAYLAAHPKPDRTAIQSYRTRRRALIGWLRQHHPRRTWTVVPISDPFGGSVGPGVDVLVVSADTVAGGRAVNAERKRRGVPSVPLVRVPLALADDLLPIASRRVRAGTIDRRGRRLSRIRVQYTASNPADRNSGLRVIRRVFRNAIVVPGSGGRAARADLSLEVRRRRAGGWVVALRSSRIRLKPTRIPGAGPFALERGLRTVLSPRSAGPPGEPF